MSAAQIIYSFCLIRDDVPPLDYRSFYLPGALALCPVFKISKILRPLAAARCLAWGVLPNMKWKEGQRDTDRGGEAVKGGEMVPLIGEEKHCRHTALPGEKLLTEDCAAHTRDVVQLQLDTNGNLCL